MRTKNLQILKVRLQDPQRIMSREQILNDLLEAYDCETEFELVNDLCTMSEAMDKLRAAIDHLDEISHRAEKLRDILPEEVK